MENSILVCDADAGTQVLLFRLLAEAGYVVRSASDGAEAVAKIESDPPSLVIANVGLPAKSGVELCTYVKARREATPVLLLAPGTAPEPIEPADGVFGLPLEPMRVLEAVQGLLAGGSESARPSSRVLVIDDDVGILELLTNLLGSEGYTVTTAACGREALEALEGELPDIVLLDVQMPGMSGFEALASIRERHALLPVIMVTGHGSEEVAADALRLGADDYIAKPLRIRNLCFRVERTLEKAHLRSEQQRLNQQLRQTTLELTDRLEGLAEANAALRALLARVLDDVRQRLEAEGVGHDTLAFLERLRAAAQADDPAAACEAVAKGMAEQP